MRSRFLEAEEVKQTNLGRFLITVFEAEDIAELPTLPVIHRFGSPIGVGSILLTDLATREGCIFDPTQNDELIRRNFLLHPIHVCILYFPVMRWIAAHPGILWKPETKLIRLSLDAVFNQPGVLVDALGRQVRTRAEWSPRIPLVARLRNREVPEGGDPEAGQGELTAAEVAERGPRPAW